MISGIPQVPVRPPAPRLARPLGSSPPPPPAPLAPAITPADYRLSTATVAGTLVRPVAVTAAVGAATGAVVALAPWLGPAAAFLCGGTVVGAVAGVIERCLSREEDSDFTPATTTAFLVGGGALLCASMAAGPLVPALSVGALALMISVCKDFETALHDQHERTDERADSGEYRTAALFRDVVRHKENPADFAGELAAAEALEQRGWRLGEKRSDYEWHDAGDRRLVHLHGPTDGFRTRILYSDLPLFAGLLCDAPFPDGAEYESASRLRALCDRGLRLCPTDDPVMERTPQTSLLELFNAISSLRYGHSVSVRVGELDIPLPSTRHETVTADVERLQPLLDACQQAPLLARAFGAMSKKNRFELGQTVTHLPDSARAEHLDALTRLATAGANAGNYKQLAFDYKTLLSVRDPHKTLPQSADEYATLLSALATLGAPAETGAETGALYKEVQAAVTADPSGASYEDRVQRLITVIASGGDLETARRALLKDSERHDSTIERNEGSVRIGGISVPVRR